ncbi:MAG: ABC transporter permease [Bacilli bacterium]|nr:ABC transporter permease [Bacilli bacterium]
MALSFVGDKKTNFAVRLKIAPISNWTYLFSFILAMSPLLFGQTLVIFLFGFIFKLPLAPTNFFLAIIYLIPSAFFFLSLGALLGVTCKNSVQVACISVFTIALTIVLGGIVLPLENLPTFENVCSYLPFYHCVQIAARLYSENDFSCIYPHIL